MLGRVLGPSQNSQKYRVVWRNCHRTHRSIGYCGATFTELTELVCGVVTDGTYPRYPREFEFVLAHFCALTKIQDKLKRARVRTDPRPQS